MSVGIICKRCGVTFDWNGNQNRRKPIYCLSCKPIGWRLKERIHNRYKKCVKCGEEYKQLHVHHIDFDGSNNKESNLTLLCVSCHHKIDAFYISKITQNQKAEWFNEWLGGD